MENSQLSTPQMIAPRKRLVFRKVQNYFPTPPQHPFRFLDLPAEVRNQVYEVALYHNRHEHSLANVALLGVNKQIHKETLDLIFEHSSFTIDIGYRIGRAMIREIHEQTENRDGDREQCVISGDMSFVHSDKSDLGSFIDIWPDQMLRMTQLTVMIPVSMCFDQGRAALLKYVNHVLYGLALQLAKPASHIRSLKLVFCGSRPVDDPDKFFRDGVFVHTSIYPISRLPARITLRQTGLSLAEGQWLQDRVDSQTMAIDIAKEIEQLQALLAAYKHAGGAKDPEFGRCFYILRIARDAMKRCEMFTKRENRLVPVLLKSGRDLRVAIDEKLRHVKA